MVEDGGGGYGGGGRRGAGIKISPRREVLYPPAASKALSEEDDIFSVYKLEQKCIFLSFFLSYLCLRRGHVFTLQLFAVFSSRPEDAMAWSAPGPGLSGFYSN